MECGKKTLMTNNFDAVQDLLEGSKPKSDEPLFGGKLDSLKTTHECKGRRWSAKLKAKAKVIAVHRAKRRLEDATDSGARYTQYVTVTKGHMKFVDRARASVRKMQYEGFNATDEVDVALTGVARPTHFNVSLPFQITASSQLATLVIVPSLNKASNVKAESGLLDPVALQAICLGQRVACMPYLEAVVKVGARTLLKQEAASLPPSVKFWPLARMHSIQWYMDSTFRQRHKNTALMLRVTCQLRASMWRIIDDSDMALLEATEKTTPKKLKQLLGASKDSLE